MKREIALWFKKEFPSPSGYMDQMDPVDLSTDPLEEDVGTVHLEPSELFQFVSRCADDGRFYCTLCDKFAHPSRNCARNHVESKHFSSTFSYHCDSCGQTLDTQAKLNHHKNVLHK